MLFFQPNVSSSKAAMAGRLLRITAGHTINKIAELAPWNYAPKPAEQSGPSAADLQAASVAEKPADQKVMAA